MHYSSRQIRSSIPVEVIGFLFHLPNPSSCTLALRSTKPVTEMSTKYLLKGKEISPVCTHYATSKEINEGNLSGYGVLRATGSGGSRTGRLATACRCGPHSDRRHET
jgi:hypothetical protein